MVERINPLIYCRVPKTASTAVHSFVENVGVLDPAQALRYEAREDVFYPGFSAAIWRKHPFVDTLKSYMMAMPMGRFILRVKPRINRAPLIPLLREGVEYGLNFGDIRYMAGHFTLLREKPRSVP